MLSGDMARHQIADRMREAEAERLVRSARRSRRSDRGGATRRNGWTALTAVLWPIRH